MKKVDILTVFNVKNYGTVLQAYATVKILTELGYEAEIVNYIDKDYSFANKREFLKFIDPKYNFGTVKKIAYILAKLPARNSEFNAFAKFRKEFLPLTDKFYDSEESLINDVPCADIYLTGSDQVWNVNNNGVVLKPLLLSFVPKGKKKIAFSASFGRDIFSEEVKDIYRPLINDYDYISVREKSGISILEELGYKKGLVTLDPTLMINKKEWSRMFSKRLFKDKYLLVYTLSPNKTSYKIAEEVAKKKSLKIIKIGIERNKPAFVDKLFKYISPQKFLNLFYHADYIVTNSFHGTAFSINFNKNFTSVKPDLYSTRMESIIEIFNLTDRLADSNYDIERLIKDINYSPVNSMLEEKREKTLKYLKESLSD